jgi:SAM-dependent methyltransferase
MTSEHHYDEKYFEWQSNVGIFGALANRIKFEELIKKNQKVLDFGCGGGYMLSTFNEIDKYGVEINDVARSEAGKKIKVFKTSKELPDEFFDLIITNHALEHCDNPFLELRELYRSLKKGGLICVVVPIDNKKNKFIKDDRFMHLYSWSPSNLGNILTASGFVVLESKPFIHTWMPYYLRIKKLVPWSIFHFLCRLYGRFDHKYRQSRAVAKKI